jgi:SAM-dependent methyltransferase
MPKQGEIDYVKNIGAAGLAHAVDKPFSDPGCAQMLVDIGIVMHLLPPPPARLLDLGCGTGWTSAFFARRGYEVVGQDIAPDMIAAARASAERQGITRARFVVSDYEGLAFEGEFDCAVFFDSLHHAVDEEAALRSAFRALRPGGVLVTHEPGEGHAAKPPAIEAMKRYGVTEKDMPPRHIVALARAIGFREARILVNSERLVLLGMGIGKTGRIARLARYRMLQPLISAAIHFSKWGRLGSMVVLTR